MKVHFNHPTQGYSGKCDGAVYYFNRRLQTSMMRLYVRPEESSANLRVKAVMANLKQIEPSEGYKQNFKDYLFKYNDLKDNRQKRMLTWNNLYIKMLYAMQKANPEADMTTLSREQIYAEDLPCQSLCKAIEAGLLPEVDGYEWYDKMI
jgi:hypothetical protein